MKRIMNINVNPMTIFSSSALSQSSQIDVNKSFQLDFIEKNKKMKLKMKRKNGRHNKKCKAYSMNRLNQKISFLYQTDKKKMGKCLYLYDYLLR